MKKLTKRTVSHMSDGVRTYGTYDPNECFHVFEEKLTVQESIFCRQFMQWVHDNKFKFGSGNVDALYEDFTKTGEFKVAKKELKKFYC